MIIKLGSPATRPAAQPGPASPSSPPCLFIMIIITITILLLLHDIVHQGFLESRLVNLRSCDSWEGLHSGVR